jgi:hypothetical protein
MTLNERLPVVTKINPRICKLQLSNGVAEISLHHTGLEATTVDISNSFPVPPHTILQRNVCCGFTPFYVHEEPWEVNMTLENFR